MEKKTMIVGVFIVIAVIGIMMMVNVEKIIKGPSDMEMAKRAAQDSGLPWSLNTPDATIGANNEGKGSFGPIVATIGIAGATISGLALYRTKKGKPLSTTGT